jgi:hypothetical protein
LKRSEPTNDYLSYKKSNQYETNDFDVKKHFEKEEKEYIFKYDSSPPEIIKMFTKKLSMEKSE